MYRRPWSLIIVVCLHLLAPVGNIIFNAVITNKNVWQYLKFATTSTYLAKNWVIIVAPIIAGIAIYLCKRWSFFVYLTSITVLFIFSYSGYMSKGGDIGFLPLFLAYLMNILVVLYVLIPSVRNIYFDRRMRWWEIKPRYQCDYRVQWKFEDNDVVHPGVVGNISQNGLFLKSDIYPRDEDMVEIKVAIDDQQEAEFKGQVVFHKAANKLGFGVKFSHTKESLKQSTEITQKLEKQGRRIQNLDLRPEDPLSFWVRTLVTNFKSARNS